MTKQELIAKLSVYDKKRNLSKAATSDIVESLFANLALALRRGRRFTYPGFGSFIVRRRKERRGRNPHTGKQMIVGPSKVVLFRPCADLRKEIN